MRQRTRPAPCFTRGALPSPRTAARRVVAMLVALGCLLSASAGSANPPSRPAPQPAPIHDNRYSFRDDRYSNGIEGTALPPRNERTRERRLIQDPDGYTASMTADQIVAAFLAAVKDLGHWGHTVGFTENGSAANGAALGWVQRALGEIEERRRAVLYTHDAAFVGRSDPAAWALSFANSERDRSRVLPDVTVPAGYEPLSPKARDRLARREAAALATVAGVLEQRSRTDVPVIVVEPLAWARGGLEVSPGYLEGLQQTADRVGALVVLDMVSEYGRTERSMGRMQVNGVPIGDLVTRGKAVPSSLSLLDPRPQAATVVSAACQALRKMTAQRPFGEPNPAIAFTAASALRYMTTREDASGETPLEHACRVAEQFPSIARGLGIKGHPRGLGCLRALAWPDGTVDRFLIPIGATPESTRTRLAEYAALRRPR